MKLTCVIFEYTRLVHAGGFSIMMMMMMMMINETDGGVGVMKRRTED